jgi:hypothetical protein
MPGNSALTEAKTSVRDITLLMYLHHQVIFQHHRGDKLGEPGYSVTSI